MAMFNGKLNRQIREHFSVNESLPDTPDFVISQLA
jgi:hypothetical protein